MAYIYAQLHKSVYPYTEDEVRVNVLPQNFLRTIYTFSPDELNRLKTYIELFQILQELPIETDKQREAYLLGILDTLSKGTFPDFTICAFLASRFNMPLVEAKKFYNKVH